MTRSSSELDAAKKHRGSEQASQADDQSAGDQTLVLDSPEDPTVPDPTGNDCQHVAMSTAKSENGELQHQKKNVEHPLDLLGQAIVAAQSGNTILARLHLDQAIASNPENPVGWLWLAWVADSPAAAVSALEQARLNFPNPSLLEHGLAWARGMQEFQLERSGLEDRAGTGAVHPGAATQLLGFAEDAEPAELPAAACGPGDHGTAQADPAPGQTLPLERETTPEKASDRPTIKNDSGTGSTQREEDQREEDPLQNAIETDSPQISGESSANDISTTVTFAGSELADFLSHMNPTTDVSGPGADNSQPSDSPPVDEPSGDQPNDGISGEPSDDAPHTVEDGSPGSTDPAPPGDQPTILAIDDSPTVRSLVSMTLQKSGYHVVTANDGVDALDRIKSCRPALILMDINMPRLNGYQLCKLVKKHKEMCQIPVIMLSGKDGVFDKLRGNMCGCDDYITKPFESADLVRKVSAFLTPVEAHA